MSDARIRGELPGLTSGRDAPVARAVRPTGLPRSGFGLCGCFATGAILSLLTVLGVNSGAQSPPKPGSGSAPGQQRLEQVVRRLASPEMEGRRGEGGRKAAAYLIEEFRRFKLEPVFSGQFVQEIPTAEPGKIQGRNVGAALRGSDPSLRDEWVIVAAHFDHLGVRNGVLFPGADDNASGVAMMLEVARNFSESPRKPRRSMMFVGFDLEELGLFGSRYFVAHPPVPLGSIALFITADMIGRALAGVCQDDVFVLGSEYAPGLRPWIEAAARERPVKVGLLGSDVLVLDRSDYGPFRSRRIPFLFFSTGENPCYHSPRDTPETLNFAKLAAISQVIHEITVAAASADRIPRWSAEPDYPLAEAITIRKVLRQFLEDRDALGLGGAQLFLMNRTLQTLDGIVARGVMTPSERAGVIQAARIILFTVQ
jgi:hypothetical protein